MPRYLSVHLKRIMNFSCSKFGLRWGVSTSLIFLLSFAVNAQQPIPLYEAGPIPFAKQGTEQPTLTIYSPSGKAQRTAVIVCSGGSYGGRANWVEGTPACLKLQQAGITAILLDYRVPSAERMDHKERVPLTDAQAAIKYVREHAKELKIDAERVGIMGFSAGGHLISTVATKFDSTLLYNPNKINLRPDFTILVYPVISFEDSLTHEGSRENLIGPNITPAKIREYSSEKNVTDNTPPAFITLGMDDSIVKPENGLYYLAALQQHQVPVELFLYTKGPHGYGANNKYATVQWTDACIQWITTDQWKQPLKK